MSEREFVFILPKGLIDADNQIHRHGKMRLTTGQDELAVQQHPLVQQRPEAVPFWLWSRVVTSLGELPEITPWLFEQLFVVDSNYLQQFYRQINQPTEESFLLGESLATPWSNCTKR